MNTATHNATETARFIGAAKGRNYPREIIDAAKQCLVDWCGVALGGKDQGAAVAVRGVAQNWGTNVIAVVVRGGRTAPAAAALINGTMAHCLDYDDTHVGATTHIGGPTIAAALAVGTHREASEQEILSAIISGFEVAARLGNGVGQEANIRGFHATGIFGCFGATAAASVLYGLDETRIRNAFGAAATQTGGLTDSFGTMSKPFHAGKAALNGVLAAELAGEGFESKEDLLEPDQGLSAALFQDGGASIGKLEYAEGWEITRNTFKPYAACLLTHPLIDAARSLADKVDVDAIESVEAVVSPFAIKLAGKPDPRSPLEGKFSLAYCAALSLNGHLASERDFADDRLADPKIRRVLERVEPRPTDDMAMTAARIVVHTADGGRLDADVPLALGNPGNPMSWDDMWRKFEPLATPAVGDRARELFDLLREFDEPGSLVRFEELLGEN